MHEIHFEIDTFHSEDLNNQNHPSIFNENDDYNMLILRLPLIEGINELDVVSLGFILSGELSYFFNPKTGLLEPLEEGLKGPFHIIDTELDKLLKSFHLYEDHLSELEESLYFGTHENHFIGKWLTAKRDLTRMERVLVRSVLVVQEMINHYEGKETFPVNHYYDLHEHLDRLHRATTLQLTKLDYLYNFHTTRTNEKMNRLIFILTMISAIFLPLNLLVGFFGMNTGGLPFSQSTNGTLYVVFSMGVLMIIATIIIFVWRQKIERSEE